MGEAWSDWYAQDFIVGQFPALDTGAAGEVVHGRVHGLPGSSSKLRYSSRWTARRSAPTRSRCPGRPALGSGGYTYGDFGRISGGAEVHADGEIWAQTLWDLRTALGSAKARALVTTGMALLPPEPSFLDARNGDPARRPDAVRRRRRGRAVGACSPAAAWASSRPSLGGDDTAPAESFALPPAADGPQGTISGRVTNALGGAAGRRRDGRARGRAEHATRRRPAPTAATRSPTCRQGTYLKVVAGGGGYDSAVTSLSVTGGATITFSPVLRRDWAATQGRRDDHRHQRPRVRRVRLRPERRRRPVPGARLVDRRGRRQVPGRPAAGRRSTSPSSRSTRPRRAATRAAPRPPATASRPRPTARPGPSRAPAPSPAPTATR